MGHAPRPDHVIDDLETLMSAKVLRALGQDPTGELAGMSLADQLIVYFNWRSRLVPPRSRTLHVSTELASSKEAVHHHAALAVIKANIQRGEDLTAHLSRGIEMRFTPSGTRPARNDRRKDLDLLISDWGIHHLHLSMSLDPDGFVSRTGDLLFAIFDPDDAYLIAVRPHGSWTTEDLVHIAIDNWPDAGLFQRLNALGLAQSFGSDERKRLRAAGVAVPIEYRGGIYLPKGVGQTTAGTPVMATRDADRVMRRLRMLRAGLRGDSDGLASELSAASISMGNCPSWEAAVQDGAYGIRERNRGMFVEVAQLG